MPRAVIRQACYNQAMGNRSFNPEYATSFMSRARQASQWRENHEVLAPGDRTPYLDKAAFVACSLLAQAIGGAELLMLDCGAVARPGKSSIPSRRTREWLVKVDDQVFSIEGPTTEPQARSSLHKRWMLGSASDPEGEFEVVVRTRNAHTNPPRGMRMDDNVIVGLCLKMEGPLAELVAAPLLQQGTVPARTTAPRRRF